MKECSVCKKKIGLFDKKISLKENEFCHTKCYSKTKEGQLYSCLIKAKAYTIDKEIDKAMKEVEKGLAIKENVLDLLCLKSSLLGMKGNVKESLEWGIKALARFEQLYGKGFIKKQLEKTRNKEISQEWLMENDFLVDQYGDLLRALILDYMTLKQYENAIPFIKEEIFIYPTFIRGFDDIAKCYFQLKNYFEAEKYYKKSLELEGCPKDFIEKRAKEFFSKIKKK
ncbi:tetratricopeptide repeat protein [Candidatus Woesearchaeota archaeon]|nr:tetratricopeptide repeat protein [Candidatus Woesearchaeota archaeon]